ncbi:MAG: hypothetical protein HY965_06300 [Ignavibacteriales bacterium]|nr:hypothetical protein [Ignavibacteriales bacterium]
MKNEKIVSSKSLVGILLVVAGSLFLLQSLHVITFTIGNYLISWPMFFIVWGILKINHDRRSFLGYIFVVFGSLYMFENIFPFIHLSSSVFIPVFFVIAGILMLFSPRTNHPGNQFWYNTCRHDFKRR